MSGVEHQIKACEAIPEKKRDLISLLDSLESENANKATIEFRMNNYLDFRAREKGVPLKGTFELTPLCNLDCKMCYVHLTREQLSATGKQLLTGEQWKRIMQQAIDHGMLYALLTGGEAMLHPDFDDIYLFLQEQGVNVSVTTNGLLVTPERIAFFLKHPPRELRFTLYGYDDDSYEEVTKHRAYEKVVEAMIRTRDAGIPMRVSITPSRYMLNSLDRTVARVKELNVPYGINSFLSEPRKETGRDGIEHDMQTEEYIRLYRKQNQLDGVIEGPAVSEDDLPLPGGGVMKELRGLRCGAGRSSFSIVWSGMMQPCLTLSAIQVRVVDSSFADAWRHIHESVREWLIPRECCGCAYEKICPICVEQHAGGAPIGHANPELCRRAMRLVSEGIVRLD